jgi:hypothetical protein
MRIDIREPLENILTLVSEDLRFAETKNAALLTANAAAVVGVMQVNPRSPTLQWAFLAIMLTCAISGVVSLISFIPRPENPYRSLGMAPSGTDNLLFFGHIQKYDPREYLRAIYASAGQADEQGSEMERMYAEQIVVSSRIAARKFTMFRWAIWITISGLVTPPLAFLLYLGINENQRERAMAALKRKRNESRPAVSVTAPAAEPSPAKK